MIEQLDLLEEFITSEKGKKVFKKVRKRMEKFEKYTDKLDTYFCLTLDGEDVNNARIICKL